MWLVDFGNDHLKSGLPMTVAELQYFEWEMGMIYLTCDLFSMPGTGRDKTIWNRTLVTIAVLEFVGPDVVKYLLNSEYNYLAYIHGMFLRERIIRIDYSKGISRPRPTESEFVPTK